jgi:hypothetical protein
MKKIKTLFVLLGLMPFGCQFNNTPENKAIINLSPSPTISNNEYIIPKNLNFPQKAFCINQNDIYKLNNKLELEEKINYNQSNIYDTLRYWSPDKLKLILLKTQDNLKIINLTGGELKIISVNYVSKQFKEIKWSPLSDKAAFIDEESGKQILKIINLKGEITNLTEVSEKFIVEKKMDTFSWSSDGKKLAYGFKNDIYTINADGTDKTKVTDVIKKFENDKHSYYSPQWSSNGKYISFLDKYLETIPEIKLIKPDGTDEKSIGFGETVKWFPEDNNLLFYNLSGDDKYWAKINAENPVKTLFLKNVYGIEFLLNQKKAFYQGYKEIGTINNDGTNELNFVGDKSLDFYNISNIGNSIIFSTYKYFYDFYGLGDTRNFHGLITSLYLIPQGATNTIKVFEKTLPTNKVAYAEDYYSEEPIHANISKDGNLIFYQFKGHYIFNIKDNSTIQIDQLLPNTWGEFYWY